MSSDKGTTRRGALLWGLGLGALLAEKAIGTAQAQVPQGSRNPSSWIRPAGLPEPQEIDYRGRYPVGSIVVIQDPRRPRLLFISNSTTAVEFPIAIGQDGMLAPVGEFAITSKEPWPKWFPTDEIVRIYPQLRQFQANGMPGGEMNPMGAMKMRLNNTLYYIHGSPTAGSIGRRASRGCIRMLNPDVLLLATMVRIGTKVYVINDARQLTNAPATAVKSTIA